jgi:Holliday junction resolvasome RuvABC ATP-dependent DNA helicase subunit
MKRSQLTSEAIVAWTVQALRDGERSVARQELPALDLTTFFRAFARATDLPNNISLALAGFGADAASLASAARKAGAGCFRHFAGDLHAAAGWRNKRKDHPVIVAFAKGKVTGVNTLKHFCQASSRELAVTLLKWAASQKDFTSTAAHVRLIEDLQRITEEGDAFSFEQIRAFLEAWSEQSGADAPRKAVTALGLLPDPNLFTASSLRDRLELNMAFMAKLRDQPASQMEVLRKRTAKAMGTDANKSEYRRSLKVLDKLQEIRRDPSPTNLYGLTLDEARAVFDPRKKSPKRDLEEAAADEREDSSNRPLNSHTLHTTCAGALLDGRDEELSHNADALSSRLREALDSGDGDGGETEWEGSVEVAGETQEVRVALDRGFVSWVRHFCSEQVWGGLIETTLPDLKRSLEDFNRPGTLEFDPERLFSKQGKEVIGLTALLKWWDSELKQRGPGDDNLESVWTEFRDLRKKLLGSLEELTHFPLYWFSGKPQVRNTTKEYLRKCGVLLGLIGSNYGYIAQKDPKLASLTLDGLLALDVVQVRQQLPDGKYSSKAVLLPTHPLHLWRYWRLSNILHGLGKELTDTDRATVVEEATDTIQFLSVIYASRLPEGRGAGQVLPVANDLYSLATFENLRNAYNGPDGQETLYYAVERFTASHRHHISPLRLLLVNAPQAGRLLLDLVALLDGRRRSSIPKLRVEVRGTRAQAARLRESLLFDTREREIIEEKIASGKLELVVDRQAKPLDDILAELREHPSHLVAVFDEAPVSVRRGGVGRNLPMSPFCVRRKVTFRPFWGEFRLEPTSGDPPFFEFIELVKHMEGKEGEGTPYAWPDAEQLQQSIDDVLAAEDFGAHWFFLADRGLPEESGMRSQRLVRRRDGQRQVLLATRNYEFLSRLMLPIFEEDTPNLLMPVERLNELLGEGAHLIGAGLLDVVKSQENRVSAEKVIGLMGTLLAARDYLRRHPGALLVSTDSQLARMWLRLGKQGERCDMLGLREEGKSLVLECIEVKSTKGMPHPADHPEIISACDQLAATLTAVREGLGDTSNAEQDGRYLAAPRNEMLKEVLVHGCMGSSATPGQREVWAGWLERLFGNKPETPELRGTIVDIAISSAQAISVEETKRGSFSFQIRHLNEFDVQRLLDPPGVPQAPDELGPNDPDRGPGGGPGDSYEPGHAATRPKGTKSRRPTGEAAASTGGKLEDRPTASTDSSRTWPPDENVFGLIGQKAAASKLQNKVALSSGTGRRFTDTLFIGSAGVGKSSLARAVAKRLIHEDPVFFSGSDLAKPTALIDRLSALEKIPRKAKGRVRVKRCLVFIDEVHAIGKPTLVALLSAMDDARIATISTVEYDFGEVVFIAATTDKGLLTDAFVSRMDIISLPNYSLEELAGIVWFKAKELFQGADLPREVCTEVAARNRCNPRRAVRGLENDLLSAFYGKLPDSVRKKKQTAIRDVAALMTTAAVAGFYESAGVDLNGLDQGAKQLLQYLKMHGPVSEDRICKGLRISNRPDFVELIEYLTRLGLVSTGHGGRSVTPLGRKYLTEVVDLRSKI